MLPYINILEYNIPMYGILIAAGILIANIAVFLMIKKNNDCMDDMIILEGYGLIGGFVGAKLMYLLILLNHISLSTLFQGKNIFLVINGGFVFYGGLILGIPVAVLGGKIHHIPSTDYLKKYIFAVPLVHAFGRIGCFCAGCCYGMPYSGIGAVNFPSNSFAPHDTLLFPIQLLESSLLFLLASTLYVFSQRNKFSYNPELYFFLYGLIRIITELFRFDSIRGIYKGLSTSQYISLSLILISFLSVLLRKLNHSHP